MPPLAAILIYAVAAAAQWQGHGSRARHAAIDAALTAYPEIHARETEKLKSGDPTARFVLRDVPDGVAVLGDGRPLPVLLRDTMPVQFFTAAHPLRLRAGHWTGVEAPLLRGPRVQAGVSRLARVSLKPNFPNPTPPSSTPALLYPPSKHARPRAHPHDRDACEMSVVVRSPAARPWCIDDAFCTARAAYSDQSWQMTILTWR